jgi:hypothetical protein
LSEVPKQLKEEIVQPRVLIVANAFLAVVMILVVLVYLVIPVFLNHDIFKWIQSYNLWVVVFGTFVPAVISLIINGKFEPVYHEHFAPKTNTKTQLCYCCGKNCDETDMKRLYVCPECSKEQKVE